MQVSALCTSTDGIGNVGGLSNVIATGEKIAETSKAVNDA